MLRIPNRTIYTAQVVTSLTQSATFTSPLYDMNQLVAKVTVGTFSGAIGQTLNIFLQTTDDGGTTWYDMVNMGTISGTASNAAALWDVIPIDVSENIAASNCSDATLPPGQVGVPMLNPAVRVKYVFAGMANTASVNVNLSIYANNQTSHQ